MFVCRVILSTRTADPRLAVCWYMCTVFVLDRRGNGKIEDKNASSGVVTHLQHDDRGYVEESDEERKEAKAPCCCLRRKEGDWHGV